MLTPLFRVIILFTKFNRGKIERDNDENTEANKDPPTKASFTQRDDDPEGDQ